MPWLLQLLSIGHECFQWFSKTQSVILISRALSRLWISYTKHLRFPERTNFLDLPPEILCEIFKHLDFKDLLSIRMVCNRIQSVTKTRQLWENLAQEIQALPGASPTEAPLDSYSDRELEEWVTRRCRIQYLWKNPERIKLHTRIIDLELRFSEARLLPGGRWVLGMTYNSKVYAWDLEDPRSIPQLLVDAGDINEQTGLTDTLNGWSFWESSDRSRLSIRMVLYNQSSYLKAQSRFCFYEVQSQGHGPQATLNIRLVNTLRCLQADHLAVALTEEYMVNVRSSTTFASARAPQIVSIFKYAPGNENLEPFTVNIVSWDIDEAWILYGDRIVFLGLRVLDIYSLEQLLRGDSDVIHPLHRLRLEDCRLSRPILTLTRDGSSEIRMTCISETKFRGLSFKQDDNNPLEIINLEHYRLGREPSAILSPGYLHSIIVVDGDYIAVEVVEHSWDSKSEGLIRYSIPLPNKLDTEVFTSQSIGLCEDLGRSVIFGRLCKDDKKRRLMVIDLLKCT